MIRTESLNQGWSMTTIITRKGAEHWGRRKLPPDVAYIVSDFEGRRTVTWSEVMANRRERQRAILENKRHVEPWRAVRLLVAYFDMDLMGGWQAFLDDWRGQPFGTWIDRDAKHAIRTVMALFPCGLLPGVTNWDDWKVVFARQYRRRTQDRQPVGVAFCWRRGWELKKIGERP